jgi:hypothetical protein
VRLPLAFEERPASNVIDACISVRKRLGGAGMPIRTVRGVDYSITAGRRSA